MRPTFAPSPPFTTAGVPLRRALHGKTAQALVSRYGADPKKMLAAVGPSIGPCCFEVDEPVMKVFAEAF